MKPFIEHCALAPLPGKGAFAGAILSHDYSVWQRQWLESGERQRQLDYWTAQLGNEHPLLELPGDRPRPPVQSHQGELYRFDLSDELAARVRAFNAERGLTLFMTMTATLAEHRQMGAQMLDRLMQHLPRLALLEADG